MLQQYDSNNDGLISWTDFTAMCKQIDIQDIEIKQYWIRFGGDPDHQEQISIDDVSRHSPVTLLPLRCQSSLLMFSFMFSICIEPTEEVLFVILMSGLCLTLCYVSSLSQRESSRSKEESPRKVRIQRAKTLAIPSNVRVASFRSSSRCFTTLFVIRSFSLYSDIRKVVDSNAKIVDE